MLREPITAPCRWTAELWTELLAGHVALQGQSRSLLAGQQAIYWQHIRQHTVTQPQEACCQFLPSSLWGRHGAVLRESQAMQLPTAAVQARHPSRRAVQVWAAVQTYLRSVIPWRPRSTLECASSFSSLASL